MSDGSNDTGVQGSKPEPFKPVSEIRSADGSMVSYDLLEESAREIGIPATAAKFKVNEHALRSRARDHKWKRIPDGRTLTKRNKSKGSELTTMTGDLSQAIDAHRATVFSKTSASIAKFRAKAPKNFREFDAADKIARRALGIDEDKPAQQSVLIQINEAIGDHEPAVPVEAYEVQPCNPESQPLETLEAGNQGSSTQDDTAQKGDIPPASAPTHEAHSLTLNAGDASRRRFVIP